MATRTATTPKKTNAVITRDYSRVNEIIAVGLLALSILVFLSLVSYNQTDYVPFITPDSIEVKNWIGVVGASISGILIDGIIGWTAYIIPALLVLISWRIFK